MSKIEWTGETWNPITGCTKISAGCKHCYAETMAKRLQAMGARGYENGFKLTVQAQDAFDKPLKRKKPTTYFVCSMSDLFQDGVSNYTISRVISIIEKCPQHTFQILTKRAERMCDYFEDNTVPKNVWLGVTCENQETANERIPYLLQIDAPVRFLSIEPMLNAIDLWEAGWFLSGENVDINWVIVGGESGKNARPMHPEWARSIRDQCQDARVPFFFKQWNEWIPQSQTSIVSVKDFGTVDMDGSFAVGNCLAKPDERVFTFKVGKKRAGRLLDGVLHDAMPEVKNG